MLRRGLSFGTITWPTQYGSGSLGAAYATPTSLDPCTLANTTFGTIPVGGACSTPGDNCAEGTFCHVDSSTSNGNGHCATEAGSGESCADARCHFGLICNQSHVCGAPLPEGAPASSVYSC